MFDLIAQSSVVSSKTALGVPAWAWGTIILLLGAFCSVGWWALKRWVIKVDKKLENIEDSFDSLPCVAESKKLNFRKRGSPPAVPLHCEIEEDSMS